MTPFTCRNGAKGHHGDMGRKLVRAVAAAAGAAALALGVAGSASAEGSYAEVTLTSGDGFDLPVASTRADTVRLTGNGPDTGGASGWFRPTVALSTLTVEFAWQTGFPVFHTCFATELRSVAGTVTLDATTPQAGISLTLTGPGGEVVATTTTDVDGAYVFEGVATGEYDVTMTVQDGLYAAGPTELPADAVAAEVTGVDFDLTADEPEAEVHDVPGTVTEPSGDPVPDAEVVLETPGGEPVAETTTDEKATSCCPTCPAGDYDLVITPPGGADR